MKIITKREDLVYLLDRFWEFIIVFGGVNVSKKRSADYLPKVEYGGGVEIDCLPGEALARPLRDNLTRNLNYLRQKHFRTDAAMADALEVSPATISAWLKGVKSPRYEDVDRIADFFNLPPIYLLAPNLQFSMERIDLSPKDLAEKVREMAEMLQEIRKNKDTKGEP